MGKKHPLEEDPFLQGAGYPKNRPRRLEDYLVANQKRGGTLAMLCGCCMRPRELPSYSFTYEESGALWDLRDNCYTLPFDATSSETSKLFIEIWNGAFPAQSINEVTDGEHWKRLGFQSRTPHTDVRAGRFALDQLHYLASTYPAKLKKLVQQAETLEYPFAISCFNVTQVVGVFFDLADQSNVSPIASGRQATLEEMKHFARLCALQNKAQGGPTMAVNEFFCALVELLHKTWECMRVAKNCNIMAFPEALKQVYNQNIAFWSKPHDSVVEFQALLQD